MRVLTGLVACVALAWAAAAMAAPGGVPGRPPGAGLPGQLEICQDNLGACTGELSTCNGELGVCSVALAASVAALTTCEDNLAACEAGAGQLPGDGVIGTPLAYEDCGDGTIADLNTGLMWEQKVEGGDGTTCLTALHGVDARCEWFDAVEYWIDSVNAEGYAGYSDWRLPHVKELQSILDYSLIEPLIQPIFGPTASFYYWSATVIGPGVPWAVGFGNGWVFWRDETYSYRVRAVRSGSCP